MQLLAPERNTQAHREPEVHLLVDQVAGLLLQLLQLRQLLPPLRLQGLSLGRRRLRRGLLLGLLLLRRQRPLPLRLGAGGLNLLCDVMGQV